MSYGPTPIERQIELMTGLNVDQQRVLSDARWERLAREAAQVLDTDPPAVV